MLTDQQADALRALARRFFDAVTDADLATVADCYADDVVIWHNFDNAEQGKAANMAVLAAIPERLTDRVYADRRVEVFDGGFVHQHVLKAKRASDGAAVAIHAVCIAHVRDGRIVRLDEYLDPGQIARPS